MNPTTKANCYLLFVTALWGITFPIIHNAVVLLNPFLFVGLRFTLAALFLLPLAWPALRKNGGKLLLGGIILGIINSAAYTSQTIGLQTIHSSRAAFITGLCVVLIPLLNPLFKLGKPSALDMLCSLLCLLGLYVLTGADFHAITTGDKWVLLCAVLFAIDISYLQKLSLRFNDHRTLAFYLILFTAPLPFLFSFHTDWHAVLYPSVLFGILFCAIAATSLALFLQAKYQPFTTAPKAALIYSLEPVFASIFGFVINGEPLTHKTYMGGLLILLSLMLPALLQLYKKAIYHYQ